MIECSFEDFKADCILLNELMKKRRKWRFEYGGSITFQREELKFTLDKFSLPLSQEEYKVLFNIYILAV